MTTRSAPSSTARPISGRLPWSRSPPAPNTQISRPGDHLAQRLQGAGQGVGRVGEIDKHAERLPALDPLQPAGHVVHRFQPADHRGQVDPVGQPDRGRDQAVVDVVDADHPRADRDRLAARGQEDRLLAGGLLEERRRDLGRRRFMPTVSTGPSIWLK